MKILLVNTVVGVGSTGKIISDISSGLHGCHIDNVVAYARAAHAKATSSAVRLAPGYIFILQSLLSKITGLSYCCSTYSTHNLFALIRKENPDIVNLHCVNGNTLNLAQTIRYLKENHIKTVLSIHAEFPYTGGCGHALDCDLWQTGCYQCPQFHQPGSQLPVSYFFDRTAEQWKLMENAYHDFEELVVTCVSPWLEERARKSPFFQGREVVTVMNGLNTDIFHPRHFEHLIHRHQLNNKKIILHVTPNFYSSIKGGQYVLKIAHRLQKERDDVRMVICGYNGNGEDLPENVIPIRFTRNQEELAEYYSMANLTLLTSLKETFSMVCAESLCCGTPIVGFKAGGPESISIGQYSEFVDFGDVDALYDSVLRWLDKPRNSSIGNTACQLYSIAAMTENYKKVFEHLIQTK